MNSRLVAALLGAALCWCASAVAQDADLILHNGKIVTVDAAFSVRQAVAVKDGRVTAVGSNQEVLREKGANTRLLDLQGKTVLPGMIDAHVHIEGSALSEFRAPLPVFHRQEVSSIRRVSTTWDASSSSPPVSAISPLRTRWPMRRRSFGMRATR